MGNMPFVSDCDVCLLGLTLKVNFLKEENKAHKSCLGLIRNLLSERTACISKWPPLEMAMISIIFRLLNRLILEANLLNFISNFYYRKSNIRLN